MQTKILLLSPWNYSCDWFNKVMQRIVPVNRDIFNTITGEERMTISVEEAICKLKYLKFFSIKTTENFIFLMMNVWLPCGKMKFKGG